LTNYVFVSTYSSVFFAITFKFNTFKMYLIETSLSQMCNYNYVKYMTHNPESKFVFKRHPVVVQ